MTYSHTVTDGDMIQYVFDAETLLLNKIDSKGYGDYNSIRLLDNQMNDIDLRNLRLVVYKENN